LIATNSGFAPSKVQPIATSFFGTPADLRDLFTGGLNMTRMVRCPDFFVTRTIAGISPWPAAGIRRRPTTTHRRRRMGCSRADNGADPAAWPTASRRCCGGRAVPPSSSRLVWPRISAQGRMFASVKPESTLPRISWKSHRSGSRDLPVVHPSMMANARNRFQSRIANNKALKRSTLC